MKLLRRTRQVPGWLKVVVHAIILMLPVALAFTLREWVEGSYQLIAGAAAAVVVLTWFALRAKSARVRRWDERRVDAEHYDAVWTNPDAFSEEQRDAAAAGRIPPR